MPRKRQSIEDRRAAHTRAKAKWRERVASQRNQGQRAELQFINSAPVREASVGVKEGPKDVNRQSSSHEASEAGDAANAPFRSYEASEVNEAEAEDGLFQLPRIP
jgi:hypothetical protein